MLVFAKAADAEKLTTPRLPRLTMPFNRTCCVCSAPFQVPTRVDPKRTCGHVCGHVLIAHTPAMFWAKVKKGKGCWIWKGAKNEHGYGLLSFKTRTYRAHRYSWELVNGNVPPGGQILHRCDVRACVNPDHLYLGNNAQNMRDKALRGRAGTRLTLDQVREIRVALAAGGVKAEIARKYGVSGSLIGGIGRGRHYGYLP